MTTQKALLTSTICLQDDLFKEEASPYLFSEHSTGQAEGMQTYADSGGVLCWWNKKRNFMRSFVSLSF